MAITITIRPCNDFKKLRVTNVTPLMVHKHQEQEDEEEKRRRLPKTCGNPRRKLVHVFWHKGSLNSEAIRTWFLEKLLECNGDCQDFTFVIDRFDAIRGSIENGFPYAHHDVCAFHLLGNIVHHLRKNDKAKVLFLRLVRAYKRNVFEDLWYTFCSTRLQLAAYLSEIPREHIPRRKRYDYLTSNSARSMNALSIDARKMPIIPLIEFFHRLSDEWCNKRHINGGMTLIWTLIMSNNKLIIYILFTR
uniref:MULE transposase domain-containing protein n=1 Tax=Lactuca sativa TaxID=4236 RepID=A0A9R1XMU4_LACSA|nr:hypothetical protein LSAT_V11C300137540 [Lactuca sativa]